MSTERKGSRGSASLRNRGGPDGKPTASQGSGVSAKTTDTRRKAGMARVDPVRAYAALGVSGKIVEVTTIPAHAEALADLLAGRVIPGRFVPDEPVEESP